MAVPRRVSRLIPRPTYANVVATLALFISLGGVSYAVVSLPPHSVGREQLKNGAVTPGALSFPLGAQIFNDRTPDDLARNPCNSPPPSGTVRIACKARSLAEAPLGQMHLRAAGEIFLTAEVDLGNEGAPGTTAGMELGLFANRGLVDSQSFSIGGNQGRHLHLQALVAAHPGTNSVGFNAEAFYLNQPPGDVIVHSVSIIAIALPAQ